MCAWLSDPLSVSSLLQVKATEVVSLWSSTSPSAAVTRKMGMRRKTMMRTGRMKRSCHPCEDLRESITLQAGTCSNPTILNPSLVPSLHSQLFLQHAKKSWEWRLGTRLPEPHRLCICFKPGTVAMVTSYPGLPRPYFISQLWRKIRNFSPQLRDKIWAWKAWVRG